MAVAVFHHIGEPTPDLFTHSIGQIRGFEGQATFDGVYTSVFDHRHELPRGSVMFVTGNMIGRDGYCNRTQLEQLAAEGFVIGWHGWSHRRLPELSLPEMSAELARPPWVAPLYAYPHGDFNEQTISTLRGLSYLYAYSTTQGIPGNDFAVPRVYI